MNGPDLSRIPEWYHRYVNLVTEPDCLKALRDQAESFTGFLQSVPPSKQDYAYAPGKWTVKQVLQHMIDAERIFAYRALCFARKDATPLPGFEEDDYAHNARTEHRTWEQMVREFDSVRQSTLSLFESFGEEEMGSEGIASGNPVYTAGIGFIIAGHMEHHRKVIQERYL